MRISTNVRHDSAAAAITAVSLRLATEGDAVALAVTERQPAALVPAIVASAPPAPATLDQYIEAQLAAAR